MAPVSKSQATPDIQGQPSNILDSQHEDSIHDAQLDYYSKRLATASSDKTVKIFAIENEKQHKLITTLSGHEGPVWKVCWAHPRFGSILASCSYDGKVIIWKEGSKANEQWIKVKEHSAHTSSVNSIAWSPEEYGLKLACASSDGKITVLTYNPESASWEDIVFPAHQIGCNSVTWCPSTIPGSLLVRESAKQAANIFADQRIASGGCDNLVKVWKFDASKNIWNCESELAAHSDWVRDVEWAPNVGIPTHTLISCSQDRTVVVWKSSDCQQWKNETLSTFNDTVWRVNFSPAGNILAVACGDNHVTMWRQEADGKWSCLKDLDQSLLPTQ